MNLQIFKYIMYLHSLVINLAVMLYGKIILIPRKNEPVKKKYRKLKVDTLPKIENIEKLNYKEILQSHFNKTGKMIKPVSRRKSSTFIDTSTVCPRCNAPHEYLYDNNGGKGQYQCKLCKATFKSGDKFKKEVILKCPHCSKSLDKIKDRKSFLIYKCRNNKCSFYISNKNSLSPEDKAKFEKDPQAFKLRYIYRLFTFDFKPLSRDSEIKGPVSLPNIRVSQHALGLILTYYVNYGLGSRKTAEIMKDIHGIKISHQSIINYANSVATLVKPFVDHYPYDITDSICGDETYIRIKGKWNYIFFFMDATKKIILSYHTSPKRDTEGAIYALDDVLSKFKKIPENLNIITDGNPIYLLAQQFFASHRINFDIVQVIGLSNDDPTSKQFRPLKQIIERLNRCFKSNYKNTHGFSKSEGALYYITLYTTYFNFLRPHQSLENKVPVKIDSLEKLPTMPARWCKLIELSQDFIINYEASA